MTLPQPYYQDEHVILYHANCVDVLPHIDQVDAVITDPPFGIGFKYENLRETYSSPQEYYAWLMPIMRLCNEKLAPGGFNAIWQAQLYFKYFWQYFGDDIHVYCAAKNFVQLRKTAINYGYDPVVMFYKYGVKLSPIKPKRSVDFFVSNTAKLVSNTKRIEKQHPCPRPLDVVLEIVSNFSTGTILDPFSGSGTTLLAAKKLGRKAIGIEVNQKYCDVFIKRVMEEDKNTL